MRPAIRAFHRRLDDLKGKLHECFGDLNRPLARGRTAMRRHMQAADELFDPLVGDLPGMLAGVRVVEIGDEQVEYAGLILAGLGAEVIKVEPLEGAPTRGIGPFIDGVADREGSLFFAHYNRAKASVRADVATEEGRALLNDLLVGADV